MNQTQQDDLIERRLSTLIPQVEAAFQAHAAIHHFGNAPVGREITGITQELQRLARLATTHANSECTGTTCNYRAQMDIVLQQADRLLQWDKECAARALKQYSVTQFYGVPNTNGTVESFDIYGNLAVLEGFVASVKSVAFPALSVAMRSHRAAPQREEEPQLPPEIYRG